MHPLALFGAAVMALAFSPARIFGIVTAVAVHEAGHVAAGAILGVRVTGINVVPFGISFDMRQPRSYLHEALIAAAGPFVNFTVCALILSGVLPSGDGVRELFVFSLSLGMLNVLPVRALDGGNVFMAAISHFFGRDCAERVLGVLSVVTLTLLYLAAVYIFFYGSENFSLLFFVCAMFTLTVVHSDGDFIK